MNWAGRILCWLGYEVDAVSSGEETLAAFDETRHALLITDHCMLRMLGPVGIVEQLDLTVTLHSDLLI